MKRTAWIVWTPLAFGLYQILRICVDDVDPVSASTCLRPIAVMTVLTVLLLWSLKFLVPGLVKRAVIVTAFYIVFLNYTLLAMLIGTVEPLRPFVKSILTNPVFAFGMIAMLMAGMIVVIRRSKSDFTTAHSALGFFATVLVILVLYQTVVPFLDGSRNRWITAADRIIDSTAAVDILPQASLPDVYYIILDGYARADVLQALYSYDNSEFLRFLSEQGFYTPSQSSSNYPQTYLSLASSLNLSYLDQLSPALDIDSRNRRPLRRLIQHNSAAQLLRRAGYRFVFLSSSYSATESNLQADIYDYRQRGLNKVENQLVFQTPLAFVEPVRIWQHDAHRQGILTSLEGVVNAASVPGPKFVFAHVLSPHPPFVFGPHGEEVTPSAPLLLNDGTHFPFSHEEYLDGYVNQLTFLNEELSEMVLSILDRSATPPIIILQADHGPGSMLDWENVGTTNATERLGIFAAYLVPEDIPIQFPETMTPVNTFRILFNTILGTDFSVEEERSYLATWSKPYEFVPVPMATQGVQIEP